MSTHPHVHDASRKRAHDLLNTLSGPIPEGMTGDIYCGINNIDNHVVAPLPHKRQRHDAAPAHVSSSSNRGGDDGDEEFEEEGGREEEEQDDVDFKMLASSYKLPSNSSLYDLWEQTKSPNPKGRYIAIDNDKLARADQDSLGTLIPQLPGPNQYFHLLLHLFKSREELPRPRGLEGIQMHACYYVNDAESLDEYFELIANQAFQYGVEWFEFHVWGPLLYNAFKSSMIAFERREFEPPVKAKSGAGSFNHEGVFRCLRTRKVDLGFVVMKPPRMDAGQGSAQDRAKLLAAMTRTLQYFQVENFMVVGILCDGFDCTIFRGVWKAGLAIIGPHELFTLQDADDISTFLELFWRVRLALEHSLDVLWAANPKQPSGKWTLPL